MSPFAEEHTQLDADQEADASQATDETTDLREAEGDHPVLRRLDPHTFFCLSLARSSLCCGSVQEIRVK